jgi:hypothetical protein
MHPSLLCIHTCIRVFIHSVLRCVKPLLLQSGMTPLGLAARQGNSALARALLEAGANAEYVPKVGTGMCVV